VLWRRVIALAHKLPVLLIGYFQSYPSRNCRGSPRAPDPQSGGPSFRPHLKCAAGYFNQVRLDRRVRFIWVIRLHGSRSRRSRSNQKIAANSAADYQHRQHDQDERQQRFFLSRSQTDVKLWKRLSRGSGKAAGTRRRRAAGLDVGSNPDRLTPAALGDIVDASCVSLSSSTFVCLATNSSVPALFAAAAFLALSFMLFPRRPAGGGLSASRASSSWAARILASSSKSDWLLMVPANGSKAVCEPFKPNVDWPGDNGLTIVLKDPLRPSRRCASTRR